MLKHSGSTHVRVRESNKSSGRSHNKLQDPLRSDNFGKDLSRDSVEQLINIRVSDAKLRDLKESSSIKRIFQKLLGVDVPMTQEEFSHQVTRLYKCCLKSVRDLHELHLRRAIGLNILEDIVTRADPCYINISHVIHLIWCIMSCIHHFQLRLRISQKGLISWARQKKCQRCLLIYKKLIKLFDKSMYRIAVNAVVTFYREGKLWEIEFACTTLIIEILQVHPKVKEDLDDIVYTIENASLENPEEAKALTKIMCEIMKNITWTKITMYLLRSILDMIECSIKPKPTDRYNYGCLRKGMEICVRHAIKNLTTTDHIQVLYLLISKMNNNFDNKEIIVCFGNLAVYAAQKYGTKAGLTPLLEGPLPIVISLFKSNIPHVMLFGLKIWQKIIDRQDNMSQFLTPIIFFPDCFYSLKVRHCHPKDKSLFKKIRHLIYEIITNCFLMFDNKAKLQIVYQTLALTLTEFPCGYSASCAITIAMTVQEYAFSIMMSNLIRSNHLHAIVLSIITLICYINHAGVFYKYVKTIIERRAELAPHLNPPLKTFYEYAQHHILWSKPELFFEDWEVRYGLWKCFRIIEPSKKVKRKKKRIQIKSEIKK